MPGPFTLKNAYLVIIVFSLLLAGCVTSGKTPPSGLSAAEYRQQAKRSVYEKRYADSVKLLQQVIMLDPSGEDYLLLGDIQEALHEYKPARRSYQKGFETGSNAEMEQLFIFHLATLEALEFEDFTEVSKLAALLPEKSPAALNLQVLQALEANHFDRALRLTEQITNSAAEQEMKGWAHYLASKAWVAVGNESKAFQSLFFAVNHARGHGLVDRITRLWEELKQRPLPE